MKSLFRKMRIDPYVIVVEASNTMLFSMPFEGCFHTLFLDHQDRNKILKLKSLEVDKFGFKQSNSYEKN